MQGMTLYVVLMLAGAGLWQTLERTKVIPVSCLVDESLFDKVKH